MTETNKRPFPPRLTVAEMLTTAMHKTRKSNKRLAADLGLGSPEDVAKLRNGRLRMDFENILLFEIVLGLERTHLVIVALAEYYPELWAGLAVVGMSPVTINERLLLRMVREVTGYRDPGFTLSTSSESDFALDTHPQKD